MKGERWRLIAAFSFAGRMSLGTALAAFQNGEQEAWECNHRLGRVVREQALRKRFAADAKQSFAPYSVPKRELGNEIVCKKLFEKLM